MSISNQKKQKDKKIQQKISSNKQQKEKLKQQAKQLLLKGCYLMAANKYVKLIQMGMSEFTSRQQAIILLNTGICYQFMSQKDDNNFVKALTYMKDAIGKDSSYQKIYYRILQLLRDHGHYQTALNLVPSNIKNPQILALIAQVRILHLQNSSLQKVIDTFRKKKQVTSQNVNVVNYKLEQQEIQYRITKLMKQNFNGQSLYLPQEVLHKTYHMGEQIGIYYYQIGTNNNRLGKDDKEKENVKLAMADFFYFMNNLFKDITKDKKLMTIAYLIFQPMLCYYRHQLNKFLDSFPQYAQFQKRLNPKTSKFVTKNQHKYIKTTKRKIFYPAQKKFIRYTRLIDILIVMFAKAYSFISDRIYQKYRKSIQKELIEQNADDFMGNKQTMVLFIQTNKIDAQQIIRHGLSKQNPNIRLKPTYGGRPGYLYENITKDEIVFLKNLLVEECRKFAGIYQSSVIHPVWLDKLQQLLYSINSLMELILSMIQIHTHKQSKPSFIINQLNQISELSHLIYIHHWQITSYNEKLREIQLSSNKIELNKKNNSNQSKQKYEDPPNFFVPKYSFKYNFQSMINYFQKTEQNFISLYLIQKILQFLHKDIPNGTKQQVEQLQSRKSSFKGRISQICLKKLQYFKDKMLKVQKIKLADSQYFYRYKQMYLIVLCIMLKLDIKQQIAIDESIVIKQLYKDVLGDVSLEVLLLVLINKQSYITYYLQNQKHITALVKHFLKGELMEKIQSFKILLNVIYMLICDFQDDQEQFFAKKLGVTQNQVHQVRKLQKQIINQKDKQNITKLRKKFKNQVSAEWFDILNQLCQNVRVKLKMESSFSCKLCKIITSIAQVNPSKLYSNQILDFMLQAKKVKQIGPFQFNIEQVACKFFQYICKRCNPQIFEYKHLQGIVDSLLWLMNHCQHELTYFESLLGLVNLSTLQVRIPIQSIEKCLYQQNKYILHAGICTMNNILIYNPQLQDDEGQCKKIRNRLSNLICQYVQFYRDQVQYFQSELPQSDYSHPKKIYNSLISLATVLKLDKLEELQSWQRGKRYIKVLANNVEAPQLMFKLVIYHSLQNKLPRNWSQGFEQELQLLKKIEPQKYLKIAQLL